jgi:predicted RNase H-like nuclease (RuvC/YqgF family)
MNRAREQWAGIDAQFCAKQNSAAANFHLIRDAQQDIAELHRERDSLKAEVESLGNELLETEARALKFFHRFSAATDLGRELREALERIAKNEVEEDDCLVPMSSEQCMQVAYDALEPFRKHAALQGEQP